ncbi:hypothetical protein BJF83_18520 [Nocardiopsis sp. CNR-923]|nr:hypothetical protein BJF83_18520 [Nocardiopsis sp. CNR-923]
MSRGLIDAYLMSITRMSASTASGEMKQADSYRLMIPLPWARQAVSVTNSCHTTRSSQVQEMT